MKGYVDTIKNFLYTSTDDIVRELREIYPEAQESQVQSWITLINDIKTADNIKDVPEDCVIALEYSLPTDGMAIDCTILGLDSNQQKSAVLLEAKQWDDDYINTQQFSSYRGDDTELHPQVQISRHKLSFSDYLNIGYDYRPYPIVYIRNCTLQTANLLIENNPLLSTKNVPVYISLQKMISENVSVLKSGSVEMIDELKNAEFCPSKGIEDAMASIIDKEEPFILTAEQQEVFEQVKENIDKGKKIIRIKGKAGSGKTAILVNLYVEYLNLEKDDIVPIFISGAQNTAYYKSKYPEVESSFTYSFSALRMLEQNRGRNGIVLMDEAQHNEPGVVTKIVDLGATVVLCYDENQIISANNSINELNILERRRDFVALELEGSVRFNSSQSAEINISNYLNGGKYTIEDDEFEFCAFVDFSSFQEKIYSTIKNNPKSKVAVMGLLSNDVQKFTCGSNRNSRLFARWGTKAECQWMPYINEKDYLKKNNGNLWVGTWWMPGLDADYVAIIVGGDAKLTINGIEAVPEQSKHYQMMISVAQALKFPELIFEKKKGRYNREYIDNYATANNIINYINSKGNETIKRVYVQQLSKYLRNNYYIMMTRGRKGCFVFFSNNEVADEEKLD